MIQFTGKVTEIKEVSGKTTRGENYQGVELTVLEADVQEGQYANCAVVYVKNGTRQQFPEGTLVDVEARVDVKRGTQGDRKFNTVMCHYIAPSAL